MLKVQSLIKLKSVKHTTVLPGDVDADLQLYTSLFKEITPENADATPEDLIPELLREFFKNDKGFQAQKKKKNKDSAL